MEYLAERYPDQERFFKYRPGHLGAVLDKLGKRHEWAEINATDFPFRDGPMSARARARDAFDPNEDSDLEAEGLNYENLHMQDGGGNLTLGDDSQDERHEHDHKGEDWDPIDDHMEAKGVHRFVRKKGKYVKVKQRKGSQRSQRSLPRTAAPTPSSSTIMLPRTMTRTVLSATSSTARIKAIQASGSELMS
jgi:hypothetical protein